MSFPWPGQPTLQTALPLRYPSPLPTPHTANFPPIDIRKPLLLSSLHASGYYGEECENRDNLHLRSFPSPKGHLPMTNDELRGIIQKFCLTARIKQCSKTSCQLQRREIYQPPLPAWKALCDWVCTVASCSILGSLDITSSIRTFLGQILMRTRPSMPTDLLEAFEQLQWLTYALGAEQVSCIPLAGYISDDMVVDAVSKARGLGICANRVWNYAAGKGVEKCIPAFMRIAQRGSPTRQADRRFLYKGHGSCTPDYCYWSDTDSTYAQQLHKCLSKECYSALEIPLDALCEGYGSVWWLDDNSSAPYLAATGSEHAEVKYMAVSHVWADGTGAGLTPGTVNSCLFRYFQDWARHLGCNGIWWDTISIPRGREDRKKAINRINDDFKNAKCTLVHDEYLVNFPWADDGSPCLALLLSPWFSRAWTGLELQSSIPDRVWVVFKDGESENGQVVKNLSTDILVDKRKRLSTSLGHILAASFIEGLCKQVCTIPGILSFLGPRTVSRPRDKIRIAGLLTGRSLNPGSPASDLPAAITKDILIAMGRIPSAFLFHGRDTMTPEGGFSWCPYSLLNGPELPVYYDCIPHDAFVGKTGSIISSFQFRILPPSDYQHLLQPHSTTVSIQCKISGALAKLGPLLLLWQSHKVTRRPLLVEPLDIAHDMVSFQSNPLQEWFRTTGLRPRVYQGIEAQYLGVVTTMLTPVLGRVLLVRMGLPRPDSPYPFHKTDGWQKLFQTSIQR